MVETTPRKSMGAELLGRRSIRRRSSLLPPAPADVDVNVNNDAAERAQARRDQIVQNFRRSSLESVMSMSSPQIREGMAECIKLNTQNKINKKNAYNLNMIDFMTYMVRNKAETNLNLQVAATGLDIMAKIYALRVDGLHDEILRMVGNLDPKDNANNQNGADDSEEGAAADGMDTEDNDNQSQKEKKKKKKKTNTKLFTTIEALKKGKKDIVRLAPVMFGETDCQSSNMLQQAIVPQHCTQSLDYHPYNDVIIDEAITDDALSENAMKIPWPPIQIDVNKQISPMFADFKFLDSGNVLLPEDTPDESAYDPLAFDLDASVAPDVEASNAMDFYETNNDEDVEFRANRNAQVQPAVCLATIENIIARVSSKPSEYSLFSNAVDICWVGPSHWKIKTLATNRSTESQATQVGRRKQKEVFELVMNNEKTEECKVRFILDTSGKVKLKTKTLKSWDERRYQRESLTFKSEDLFKTYYKVFAADDFLNKGQSSPGVELFDENEKYNYDNPNDTLNYCPNVDMDENSIDNIAEPEASMEDDNLADTDVANGFVGTNLVEAPKLTQKIYIPFSQRAKKLDMRNLKKCIWRSLTTSNETDENNIQDSETDQEKTSMMNEQKSFMEIFEKLPNSLNKNDAAELSFPIALVSLLHLANEKVLKLSTNHALSEIFVQQDIPKRL